MEFAWQILTAAELHTADIHVVDTHHFLLNTYLLKYKEGQKRAFFFSVLIIYSRNKLLWEHILGLDLMISRCHFQTLTFCDLHREISYTRAESNCGERWGDHVAKPTQDEKQTPKRIHSFLHLLH